MQEVPGVNAQEKTKDELLRSLTEALCEAIEFNREEARKAADSDYEEEPLLLDNSARKEAISRRRDANSKWVMV